MYLPSHRRSNSLSAKWTLTGPDSGGRIVIPSDARNGPKSAGPPTDHHHTLFASDSGVDIHLFDRCEEKLTVSTSSSRQHKVTRIRSSDAASHPLFLSSPTSSSPTSSTSSSSSLPSSPYIGTLKRCEGSMDLSSVPGDVNFHVDISVDFVPYCFARSRTPSSANVLSDAAVQVTVQSLSTVLSLKRMLSGMVQSASLQYEISDAVLKNSLQLYRNGVFMDDDWAPLYTVPLNDGDVVHCVCFSNP